MHWPARSPPSRDHAVTVRLGVLVMPRSRARTCHALQVLARVSVTTMLHGVLAFPLHVRCTPLAFALRACSHLRYARARICVTSPLLDRYEPTRNYYLWTRFRSLPIGSQLTHNRVTSVGLVTSLITSLVFLQCGVWHTHLPFRRRAARAACGRSTLLAAGVTGGTAGVAHVDIRVGIRERICG